MKPKNVFKRFLRSPRVIVAEIAAIAILSALGALFPQQGIASTAPLERLHGGGPVATTLVNIFALDHVFRSGWFLGLTALAAASLSLAVIEQTRRLRTWWSKRLTVAYFHGAPYHIGFERPARQSRRSLQPLCARQDAESSSLDAEATIVKISTKNKIGLAGSPLFHLGLLLLVIAGAVRALFSSEAMADLIEGETLPPTAEAWTTQSPGIWAAPIRLEIPVTLDRVHSARYESGDLRDLAVRLSLHRPEGVAPAEIAVNRGFRAPGGRLFLGSDFGPAALLEWQQNDVPALQEAVLMESQGKGAYTASASGPDGLRAYLGARMDDTGNRPSPVEMRVMKGNALLYAGEMPIGGVASLPDGASLMVQGTPSWARLRGSRDPSLGVAYAGFGLALAGATLMFSVVKVDTCVAITPLDDTERVFVALRPQRFAPLYREQFQQLVRQEGGCA